MSNQTYTSKYTSVNTKKIPAIYKRIDWDKIRGTFPWKKKFMVFDYGCGREWINISIYMAGRNWGYMGWDPYWKNGADFDTFDAWFKKSYNDPQCLAVILTSNVLNVINDIQEIHNIKYYCSQSVKALYFHKIYQGDKSGIPRVTKTDCFQQNKPGTFYIDRKTQVEVVKGGDIITNSLYAKFIKSK